MTTNALEEERRSDISQDDITQDDITQDDITQDDETMATDASVRSERQMTADDEVIPGLQTP